MNRRSFLKQSCGACAAMSLGALLGSSLLESCGSTGLGVLKASQTDGKVSIPLTQFDGGHSFQLLRVSNYNYDIAVQKKDDGTYSAMLLMCTHARHPLTKAGSGYYCTLHGSKFAADGKVEKGPASKPMVHLPAIVAGDQLVVTL
ncbi:QcrA and Rieske domain-containing protein [Taibaiella koreensis]|uniref:QcrA and Rieske domain-containing protein n=1 Tax=Taibaiella koreensis TaxID=1268548 RepID=UPI000E599106|nr:Rieske (2Fe-2S) protein [Taibaiella koreensis]